MVWDKVIILLIVGSTCIGGLLVLSLCAYRIHLHQNQIKIMIAEHQQEKKRRQLGLLPSADE